nr:unnamed protein product [Digitaria exilis]
MASASQGERAVAGLEDGESAVPMSVEGELAVPIAGDGKRAVVGSAEGGGTLLRSLEYPCTARLRRRRLLAYLRGHSCDEIYEAAKEKICVIFHVRDLVKQVKAGQLREAYYYIRSFAPINQSSSEASLLALFLQDLMAINCFVNGQTTVASILCDWFISIYRHPVLAKYPCFAALVVDILFLRSNHLRASLDWQLVRNKAAEIAEEMAYKTPELKGRMHYPRGRNDLENVSNTVILTDFLAI